MKKNKWKVIKIDLPKEVADFINKTVKDNPGICSNCVLLSAVFNKIMSNMKHKKEK